MKKVIVSPELKMRAKSDASSHEAFHKDVEVEDSPEHKAKIKRVEQRGEFATATMAERVAKSTFYYLNYKIPHADKLYPIDIDSRFVTKFFPYAEGGALYVDEPRTEAEMIKAYEKQKVLQKMGLRALVILKADAFKDLQTVYMECLEQLGEM